MRLKNLLIPVLCGALFLGSQKQAHAEPNLHLGLFPEQPLYKTIMVDPDVFRTEIQVPRGLEQEILQNPIKEILPYISVSKTLPLASLEISNRSLLSAMPKTAEDENGELSDRIISASLVASGQLNFPQNQATEIDYQTKLELFLSSPMINTCLSEGDRVYIVAGLTGQGSTNLNELSNKTLSQIPESFIDEYSFSGDLYIVPKSPYSEQYLILRIGVDNIAGNTPETPNVNISTTWEFPPLFYGLDMLENFKLLPYASMYFKIPTDNQKPTEISGQLGLKVSGESEKGLFLYTQVNYREQEPWNFYVGLKTEF